MAIYTSLPIYGDLYALTRLITECMLNMRRDLREEVVRPLKKTCETMSVLIYRANTDRNKVPHLSAFLERLQEVILGIRLAHDMRAMSHRRYAEAIKLIDSISRQATGWRSQSMSSPAASGASR